MSLTTLELYRRMASLYDVFYGAVLQPGRRRAIARLAPRSGESILEVGVGTGFGLGEYPADCRVVAVDLSAPMIAKAHARLRRRRLEHVALCRMDATSLAFPDACFDAVYAPYVINVVPDPVMVAREMLRVCRPGGRLVLLNHFERINGSSTPVHRLIGHVATKLTGVNWYLGFPEFLRDTGLAPQLTEPVNIAHVSSVVLCRKS